MHKLTGKECLYVSMAHDMRERFLVNAWHMVGIGKLTATICCQFQIYPDSVGVYQRRNLHGFGKEWSSGRIATLGRVDLQRKSHNILEKAFGLATWSYPSSRDPQGQSRQGRLGSNSCR